ncbi:MAG TPA: SDR family oxidoreductase [Gammaproteobacteria bacterium]|nr:SDR family oxidoreductase [Gammaproteobacteria bacterium]
MNNTSSPRILVFGATSAIAEQALRCFAADGAHMYLLARSEEKLRALAADLRIRGGQEVHTEAFDAAAPMQPESIFEHAVSAMGGVDVLFVAYGSLPDQPACQASPIAFRREFDLNALSIMELLTVAANLFEKQAAGVIAVITSVAGERGRQSNYVYGAAKGAVSLFLQGLRNRLFPAGVAVVDIRPGFVDTPMTREFSKGLLWASPETVGHGIYKAIKRRKQVVYLPWFWRWIMVIIRSIPETLFKRLKL